MSTCSTTIAALILLAATAATAGDALAQRTRADSRESNRALANRSDDRAHAGHRDERGDDHRALSAAVRRVERRTGGQVLSAERVPYDGRDINRIKVVDASGRVRVYVDDPRAREPQGRVRTRGDDN